MQVGDGPDVLAFDKSLRRLYVAAESGVVTVAAERGRRLAKLGQGLLAPNAHTVAVDPRDPRRLLPARERARAADHEADGIAADKKRARTMQTAFAFTSRPV